MFSFLGNIGYAQKPGQIIAAAKLLRDQQGIMLLFVGDGVEKAGLILEECARSKLNNVMFMPPQPHERSLPSLIWQTHAWCIWPGQSSMKFHPSKTYEYMAMGKPIIMAVQGEAASLIRRHGCGLIVEPENPGELRNAILTLANHPEKGRALGEKARSAALKYSASQLVDKYRNLIETCIKSRG